MLICLNFLSKYALLVVSSSSKMYACCIIPLVKKKRMGLPSRPGQYLILVDIYDMLASFDWANPSRLQMEIRRPGVRGRNSLPELTID